MLNLSGRELLNVPDPPYSRREYLRDGLLLMAVKYTVDVVVIYFTTRLIWTPADYVLAMASMDGDKAARFTPGLSLLLLVWTLPFLWIGVMLSVRRAKDAGLSPWFVVAFFIPVANYLLMTTLAAWPTATIRIEPPEDPVYDEAGRSWWQGLVAGILCGVLGGISFVAFVILVLPGYGLTMFVATPFVIGATSAYAARKFNPESNTPSIVVLATLGVVGGTFVLVAIEGITCLIMAVPLTVPIALLGGLVGHSLAADQELRGTIALIVLLLPAGQTIDRALDRAPAREVFSAIEIAASPAQVWQHVVKFDEIKSPPAWYFGAGLAYPLRARIEGTGVGAVRHCEFTTGAFREPITQWDEPSRLAFDVTDQPPPLQEWSPYRNVYAPHLKGFFTTTRGEFRLIALPGGRTRLEGRTWYSLKMEPQGYWTLIADAIVHRIHERVLDHIRQEVEGR